ncbi:hypothetical protein [Bradyrhizobium sp. NP1]|uniref:hypothetical protein n=1 Tax=Bradyrhizobium sp. NP1 TaxID=3049772 RepID=UPI0025A65CF6|nr:hypothetical protein [Bradyrhizobium sp. NP1]WJR75193.1 hypothetical protein QOU61_20490 [Bradyrhizobium sp. NP1]
MAAAGQAFAMFVARRVLQEFPASMVAVTPFLVVALWLAFRPSVVAQDFEECAALAESAMPGAEQAARMTDCAARFAGRRKAGGGYSYYDVLQDRSFDIAGPNPTVEERNRIDMEYMRFLDAQRREDASIASERRDAAMLLAAAPEAAEVPLPISLRRPVAARAKSKSCTIQSSLSCSWTKLTSVVRNAFASSPKAGATAGSH